MRLAAFGLVLAWAVLVAGCGSDEPLAGGGVVEFSPAASGPTPFGEIPFPSDLYLNADGSVGEVPDLERVIAKPAPVREGLSVLSGFGRSTGALFFTEAAIDPDSLPSTWDAANAPDASVLIVDVDPASPHLGERYPAVAKALPSLGCVSVIPAVGVVLPPGVRHAVVLTHRVTAGGVPLATAPRLDALLATAAGSRIGAAEKLYGDAGDQLIASGAVKSRAEIVALAVFTTSDQQKELYALRDQLRSEPGPALILDPAKAAPYTVITFGVSTTPSLDDWLGTPDKDETGREWPGGDNPGGIAHDQIAAVMSAAFVAPSFRDPKTHHFERDASGAYLLADPTATIPVTLVVPKSPPPPSGYPVIINGHGLSNNRGSMLAVANEFCRAGFAVIGIDDVEHGARAGIADQKNNYAGKYAGPDGIPDELPLAASFFAGFSDFVAVRDNFRQTVLDQASLVRLVESPNLDLSPLATATGGAVPVLDPKRIYWSGGSLGGIMGAMTIAVEPDIRAAALQVPGASFVQLITTGSAKLSGLVSTILTGAFGLAGDEVADEYHPLAHLLAEVTEAGDPIAYADRIAKDPMPGTEPRDVMITYAAYDEVLPNIATLALIRALGAELATPKLFELPGVPTTPAPVSGNVAGRTLVAVQYSPANHGLGYVRWDTREYLPGVPVDGDPRFPRVPKAFQIEMPIREHADQLVAFLKSANQGSATVTMTAPPVPDFDGDGVLDADDASPYDPTTH